MHACNLEVTSVAPSCIKADAMEIMCASRYLPGRTCQWHGRAFSMVWPSSRRPTNSWRRCKSSSTIFNRCWNQSPSELHLFDVASRYPQLEDVISACFPYAVNCRATSQLLATVASDSAEAEVVRATVAAEEKDVLVMQQETQVMTVC